MIKCTWQRFNWDVYVLDENLLGRMYSKAGLKDLGYKLGKKYIKQKYSDLTKYHLIKIK